MFSDEMIGLDIAHRRELKNLRRDAQTLVDRKDCEIIALRRQLAQARADIAREKGARIALQLQLDEILDMEV